MKRSVIADHLADHAREDYESLKFDFPDEDVLSVEEGKLGWWTMYFDINVCGDRASAMIISLNKKEYSVLVKLQFGSILVLEVALELNIRKIDVYGDSILIIFLVKGKGQTKGGKLRPY